MIIFISKYINIYNHIGRWNVKGRADKLSLSLLIKMLDPALYGYHMKYDLNI